MKRRLGLLAVVACLLAVAGCDLQDMYNHAKERPLGHSSFFKDGRSSRPLLDDTVARGHLRTDELLYTGKINGVPVNEFPYPVTPAMLDRGRLEFNIFCSVCHGRDGNGDGMVVQRGFKQPPSYNTDRLRAAPAGHFFDVITNGFGVMFPYKDRIPVSDRWAIVAYIRALQLSQHASPADVPPAERATLQAGGQ